MNKWTIDKQETYITVHETNNKSNCAYFAKAGLVYGEFGEITGFKISESSIKQANKIRDMLNELEDYRSIGTVNEITEFKKQIEKLKKENKSLLISASSLLDEVSKMKEINHGH